MWIVHNIVSLANSYLFYVVYVPPFVYADRLNTCRRLFKNTTELCILLVNYVCLLTLRIQLQSQLRQLLMCYDRLASIDLPKNWILCMSLDCTVCHVLFRARGWGVVPFPRHTYDNNFHCENIIMRVREKFHQQVWPSSHDCESNGRIVCSNTALSSRRPIHNVFYKSIVEALTIFQSALRIYHHHFGVSGYLSICISWMYQLSDI